MYNLSSLFVGGVDMISKYCLVFVILFLFIFVSCAPSEQAIQEALDKTQNAAITNTFTIEPTLTFTHEPTSTHTLTFTPSASSTSTPTITPTPDARVITTDSKELMITKNDLPPEAKYYLPNAGWISPHHNSEIISGWGVEEGAKYLEETGRVDGWFVYYKRGTSTIRAPEEIYQNIIQYKSSEGAYFTISKYPYNRNNPDIKVVEYDVLIGDLINIYVWKEMQSNGEYRIDYTIESQYRNYVSIVSGWGWEKEFDLEYVIRIAEIAMDKIKAAPLGNW